MKIALAIMSMELGGGAEHDILHLSSGLKKAGHEPIVITSGGRLCKEIEAEGVKIVLCPLLTRSIPQLWKNGKRLANIIEEHHIDVINPQGVYPGLSGYWATRRLLKKGIYVPNIITIHNLNRFTWWYYKLGSAVINYAGDHVIVESDCERLRLQNAGMHRPINVIHNCFPGGKLDAVTEDRSQVRQQMGWDEDKIVVIMPARMSPEKNHRCLLEAAAREDLRNLPILYYLAGDGPLEAENRALVKEFHLEDKVQFGGFRRDLPKLYKGADIFLLCSRYESLPLSIREGMGASLPVIATDVGGISEAVEQEKSGLLVASDDSAGLASAIIRLALNPELRRTLGCRGREIYIDKFDYDNWIAKTASVMGRIKDDFQKKYSR